MTMHPLSPALGPEFNDFVDDPVVGSSIHQEAIVALLQGLDGCAAKGDLPWFVGNRLPLIFSRGVDRPADEQVPDVCVHPTLTGAPRDSLIIAQAEPSALIIEVADPKIRGERDLTADTRPGKPDLYATAEIPEYLVFDPQAEFVGNQIWAVRLGPDGYESWLPGEDGRWHSESLGISFAPRGFLLRVYDQDGALVPLHRELRGENTELRDENAAMRARLAALEAELRRRDA